MERKTGQHTQEQGHKEYFVHDLKEQLVVEPVEMAEGKWYEPVLDLARRVVDRAKEIIS